MRPRMWVALLSLVGVLLATYLSLYKLGVIGELVCQVGTCERVQTSRWSLLFGIPVAVWGLLAYVTLLVLALIGTSERYEESRRIALALVALSGWGVLFSAWLTYLELFVIHAICQWCVGSAVLVTLIFIASLADLRSTGIPPDEPRAA